eukprot:9953349-Alexandrium_andersonii.AAC.1
MLANQLKQILGNVKQLLQAVRKPSACATREGRERERSQRGASSRGRDRTRIGPRARPVGTERPDMMGRRGRGGSLQWLRACSFFPPSC